MREDDMTRAEDEKAIEEAIQLGIDTGRIKVYDYEKEKEKDGQDKKN